ncbi:MAG TPA: FKBP-type peptidyl-prolyl cis-trans isomerase [Polyangiaceae bacterium]|jgi:FKBP-type peptidyl-prolyl cis-trans isomerase
MHLVRAFSTAALGGLLACSNLTSPPAPEPIASDTPVTMAPASAPPQHGRERPRPDEGQPQQPSGEEGELKIDDTVVGKGPAVKPGDVVVVHYVGTLTNGTKFDASRDHPAMRGEPAGAPFTTRIPGGVIEGWNKGLLGMRVGGKRHLVVPPSMGYGARPKPGIPPNSTLVFDVELLEIKNAPPRPQMQLPPRHP